MISLPDHDKGRVATGTVQFGTDWPGYFFRGDEALALADLLDAASKTAAFPYADELRRYAVQIRECGSWPT